MVVYCIYNLFFNSYVIRYHGYANFATGKTKKQKIRVTASGSLLSPQNNWGRSTRTAKDGRGSIQQRCFVHTQNSPSTVVHGCTTVEDGSNGLTVSIFPWFLSTLPDAFILSPKKYAKFYFLKMQQLNKILILETVALVRLKRTHQYASFRKKTWRLRWAATL